MLLTQWANTGDRRFVWLSLGPSHAGLEAYVQALLEALQAGLPAFGSKTSRLIRGRRAAPATLAAAAVSDLEKAVEPTILILDNYEWVRDPEAHEFTGALVRSLPPSLHVVLSTRVDPPIPLARWRAADQLSELRAADLYFSRDEAEAFLASLIHEDRHASLLDSIVSQTQGWPAGLRLAGLALSSSRTIDPDRLPMGRSRLVMDYFLEEVLAQEGPALVGLLIRSSILDELEAHLVSDVARLPLRTAADYLDHLERNGLFVVGLEGRDGWYRAHPMLRDTLRRKLEITETPEAVALLHRSASAWYAANGFPEAAIRHAALAGDSDRAGDLAETMILDALSAEDMLLMERLLGLLPDQVVRQRPILLAVQARLIGGRVGWEAAAAVLHEAQRLVDRSPTAGSSEAGRIASGLIDTFFAPARFFAGDVAGALQHAERSVETLGGRLAYSAGWGTFFAAVCEHILGNPGASRKILSRALESREASGDGFVASFALFGYAVTHLLAGRLTESDRAASAMLAIESAAGREFGVAWASYFLGVVAYETNRLADAVEHFERGLTVRRSTSALALRDTFLGAALAKQALGRTSEAVAFLDQAQEYVLQSDNVTFLPYLHSLRARLALMRGDPVEAAGWLEITPHPLPPGPMVFLEVPPLTAARALVFDPNRPDPKAALDLLSEVEARCRAQHNERYAVPVLALQALAWSRLGRTSLAHERLGDALESGRRGGFVRSFVDLGPPMVALLQDHAAHGPAAAMVDRLLAAFAGGEPGQAGEAVLAEPLTQRELEVLPLLQKRLTNHEIAQALGISVLTVKRHTGNLYAKLEAPGRREAVRKAVSLGLLPPEG
jgi:LuxR family maltose regulon positive regulatory protein